MNTMRDLLEGEPFVPPTRLQRLLALFPAMYWNVLSLLVGGWWPYGISMCLDRKYKPWRGRVWEYVNAQRWYWVERNAGRI